MRTKEMGDPVPEDALNAMRGERGGGREGGGGGDRRDMGRSERGTGEG